MVEDAGGKVPDRGVRVRDTRHRRGDCSRAHHDPHNQPPGAQPTDASSEGRESEEAEHIARRYNRGLDVLPVEVGRLRESDQTGRDRESHPTAGVL